MISLRTPLSTKTKAPQDLAHRERSDAARTAVLVLGMHRSGTSALTRVLGLCGAALPSHSPFDSTDSNPLGHWEPRGIVETHDRFLSEHGLGWDEAFEFLPSIFESPRADFYRDRLAEIARAEYGRSPMFVLKDPRLSRLMPLWRPVLGRLGASPRAIIAVRNPLDVAASLFRRDGWDEHRALVVWMRYMLTAERDTRGMPRCFARHDRLVTDWRPLIRSISDGLNIPLAGGDAVAGKIDAFIRKDLVHHRSSDDDVFERPDIPDCVKQVYRLCCAAADTEPLDLQAFDSVGEALDDAEQSYRVTGGIELLRDRAQNVIDIRRHRAHRDALVALSAAELGRARDQARLAQRELDWILKTRSWRYTRPFRAISYIVQRAVRLAAKRMPSPGSAR